MQTFLTLDLRLMRLEWFSTSARSKNEHAIDSLFELRGQSNRRWSRSSDSITRFFPLKKKVVNLVCEGSTFIKINRKGNPVSLKGLKNKCVQRVQQRFRKLQGDNCRFNNFSHRCRGLVLRAHGPKIVDRLPKTSQNFRATQRNTNQLDLIIQGLITLWKILVIRGFYLSTLRYLMRQLASLHIERRSIREKIVRYFA